MVLSAPLLERKKVIQVKVEAAKGTYLATTPLDVLVWDLEANTEESWVERKLSGKVMGHTSPGVNDGTGAGSCKFKTELRGTGTGGMDLGLVPLVQACGLLQTAQVYTPTSVHASQKTISILVYEDGRLKTLSGCTGNMKMDSDDGRIVLDFEFFGVWRAPVDGALPTVAYATRAPISWGNASNAFTLAGETIKISKFGFDLGNEVVPRWDGGRVGYYMITDRDPTLTIDPEADLVAGYDLYGAWLVGTEVVVSLAVTDGTDTCTLAIPKFQYRPPKEAERDGIMIDDVTGQCNINVITTGDDEFSLTFT